ncbi:MAG: acyltransferase family protein [Bacteroidaceae bacterium]|nr:acyltransferase family protein [Bacteroidaceae bacterium]
MTKRYDYLDVAKGIGILLVLLHHLIGHYGISTSISSYLMAFISPFNVTIFFFISGFLFSRKTSYKEFLINKFKKLVVPFFFFYLTSLGLVLAMLTYGVDIPYLHNISTLRLIGDFWMNSCQWVNIPLWFFQSMFWCSIMYYAITSLKKAHIRYLLSMTLILIGTILSVYRIQLPMGLASSLTCMSFIELGNFYREWSEHNSMKYGFGFILAILYIALLFINRSFGWMLNEFNHPLIAIVCGGIGTILLIEFCKKIKTSYFLQFCGQNSLVFFSTHYLVLRLVSKLLSVIGDVNLEMTLSYISMIIICAILSIVLNKCCPVLIGKANK